MSSILNSYFVKTHRLEISITIIAIVLFLIYFFGATHVFTRFPIYRAFMQSMPFFGIIAISATFVVTLGEIDLSSYVVGYNKNNYKYELYAICNHHGSVYGGHYTANVKKDGKWFNYNDTVIKELPENNVITNEAYCLFLKKKLSNI